MRFPAETQIGCGSNYRQLPTFTSRTVSRDCKISSGLEWIACDLDVRDPSKCWKSRPLALQLTTVAAVRPRLTFPFMVAHYPLCKAPCVHVLRDQGQQRDS